MSDPKGPTRSPVGPRSEVARSAAEGGAADAVPNAAQRDAAANAADAVPNAAQRDAAANAADAVPNAAQRDAAGGAADAEAARAGDARNAGRGGLAVAGAKLWFIVVGLLQQTMLPRFIGMDGYGAFSIVLAVANIPNNVITASSIQGVSRAVAGAGAGREEEAQRRVLVIHATLAPLLAGVFLAVAPLAAAFEHAPHILTPLRIFAVVLFVYGLYTPLVGVLNGKRRFLAQAGLDITFASLRTVGLLAAAYWAGQRGAGATGAAIGVAMAATAILPFAWVLAGTGRRGTSGPTFTQHLTVLAPIALGQLFLNLLMQADIWLLRRFAHESGERAGVVGEALRVQTDALVGAYRAAQLFAFLPYQLLLSITFILFPMVARAHARHEHDAVQRYVRTGFRLAFILAGLMISCTSGLGPLLLRFAFPPAAAEQGGSALRLLALGQGAFAIFGIETTVLVSLSRERWTALLTAVASFLVAVLCYALVPASPFDATLLVRTATATSAALWLAAIVGAFALRRAAGGFVPFRTLARTGIALACAIAVGTRMPWHGRAFVLVEIASVAMTYVVVCLVTGELTRADWRLVRNTLARKR